MGRLSNLRVVDPVLTNLAVGYTNAQLIAEALFPFVDVEKEAGTIPIFGKEHFKIYATERALRASSNRISPEDVGSVKFSLTEHDLEFPIDYRESAESAFPLQASATNIVTGGIRMRHEFLSASIAQNPANYAVSNKITLSGTSQFSHPDSDPEGVIDDGKAAVRAKIAKEPNTAVIGYQTWRKLKRHPQLKAILSDTRSRLVQLADLREIFEIENIVVGRALKSSDGGDTSDMWADNIILAYVPTTNGGNAARSIYEPSYGYTLRKKERMGVDMRDEGGKLQLVRDTEIFAPYLLGADAGYLISDTNA